MNYVHLGQFILIYDLKTFLCGILIDNVNVLLLKGGEI